MLKPTLNIAFIGNYSPRICGIATFTTDICEATAKLISPRSSVFAVAVNDSNKEYAYPRRVAFTMRQTQQKDYFEAANFINASNTDIVCIQHEYGIYGGWDGIYILSLISNLSVPVVVVLHTVLKNPTPNQKKIIQELGQEKVMPPLKEEPEKLAEIFEKNFRSRLEETLYLKEKKVRNQTLFKLKEEWDEKVTKEVGEEFKEVLNRFWEEKIDEIVHKNILEKELRPDGRGLKELRPLWAGVGILPRIHGSGLFYRGETHVLSLATLGGPGDTQLVEGMSIRAKKRFMHHYNFPPFAPGETGRMGNPGRREIGHGALAERSLLPILPGISEFPYTIRVVSEVLSSNGSTSMASACASTLALMDAGVPIKRPVAGIAMGLVMENPKSEIRNPKFKVLTDIQGPEDHYGDMDFKSAGTSQGVSAIQMDVKVLGVTLEILRQTLADAKAAREKILAVMLSALPAPRAELSQYAPRILTLKINPEKIRELIGPGGKMINAIIAETGATIDVEQDGTVFVTGSKEASEKALEKIKEVTHEYQVGETFEGTISRIFDFGAMVEFAPKQEGLVHISELAPWHVKNVTDVVDIGDRVKVKIKSIDELGRINLSIKEVASLEPKKQAAKPATWSPKHQSR